MESDNHYGVTLAAIAVGVAPETYRETDEAQAGLKKSTSILRLIPRLRYIIAR